jgi:hypothetical protein
MTGRVTHRVSAFLKKVFSPNANTAKLTKLNQLPAVGEVAFLYRKDDLMKLMVSIVTLGAALRLDLPKINLAHTGTSPLEHLFGVMRLAAHGDNHALKLLRQIVKAGLVQEITRFYELPIFQKSHAQLGGTVDDRDIPLENCDWAPEIDVQTVPAFLRLCLPLDRNLEALENVDQFVEMRAYFTALFVGADDRQPKGEDSCLAACCTLTKIQCVEQYQQNITKQVYRWGKVVTAKLVDVIRNQEYEGDWHGLCAVFPYEEDFISRGVIKVVNPEYGADFTEEQLQKLGFHS